MPKEQKVFTKGRLTLPAPPDFRYLPAPALSPQPGCPWAETMVLNPAIVKDPESNALHMLFRASGPFPGKKARPECEDPYPIFLGYARSDDLGKTWVADFSRPALAPALEYEMPRIYAVDDEGRKVVNYANGCIEDPRVFEIEGVWYMSVACRMFPPGPYWKPRTASSNQPDWAGTPANPFGKAASWNDTTTVLYRLHLDRLIRKDYDHAFVYVGPLTDPEVDDNRDAFLFPERMNIDGVLQYVLIHRPRNPSSCQAGEGHDKPSIMLAAAPGLKDFVTSKARHHFLAAGLFDWEGERIGASWPPIKIGDREWLMQVHGKTSAIPNLKFFGLPAGDM